MQPSIDYTIYLSIHLSIHLYIHLSIYISIYQLIYLSLYPSIYPSIYLAIHLSIWSTLLVYLSLYPSTHPSIYLASYPCSCSFIYLSIYLPIYQSIHILFQDSVKLSRSLRSAILSARQESGSPNLHRYSLLPGCCLSHHYRCQPHHHHHHHRLHFHMQLILDLKVSRLAFPIGPLRRPCLSLLGTRRDNRAEQVWQFPISTTHRHCRPRVPPLLREGSGWREVRRVERQRGEERER